MKKSMQDKEYSRNGVPESEKKPWYSLAIVWAGIIFTVLSMTTGGGLGVGLPFKSLLLACVLGVAFLTLICILLSILACNTGLTFGLMTNYVFGSKAASIVTAILPLANIGWFIIIAATFGHFIALALGLGTFGESVCMLVGTLAMGAMALYGFKALSILSYVSMPIIIVLCIYVAVTSVNTMGGMEAVWAYEPKKINTITLSAAITSVIGTWISGAATGIANFTRFAKDTKSVLLICFTGMFVADLFMLVCGALCAMGMHTGDIPSVLVGLGLIIPGAILMMANTFTSNVGTLYSTSLILSNSFPFKREKMIVVITIVGAILTLFRPNDVSFVFSVLNVLGILFSPFAGILIGDYYLLNRMRYPRFESADFCKINPWALVSWGICIVLEILIPIGSEAINGLILGVIVYTIIMKLSKFKVVIRENTTPSEE